MHEPPPSGPFRTRIRVRYEETDAAGVVDDANYLIYFEVARVEALRAVGMPIAEVERRGVTLPAVSASCTYHSPAHVDDLLEVAMWTDHVGRASFGFGYEVRRVGDGATPFDQRSARPRPMRRRPARPRSTTCARSDRAGRKRRRGHAGRERHDAPRGRGPRHDEAGAHRGLDCRAHGSGTRVAAAIMSTTPPIEDFELRMPDDLGVEHCYRHPDRETGVRCANCGRPICHECMTPAAVGFRCPECMAEQRRGGGRPRVVTRQQTRSRWQQHRRLRRKLGITVTKVLIAINVLVFLVELRPTRRTDINQIVRLGGLVPAYVIERHEYWRLFASMFLHESFWPHPASTCSPSGSSASTPRPCSVAPSSSCSTW